MAVLTFSDVMQLLQLISVAGLFKKIKDSFHRAAFFQSYVSYYDSWRNEDETLELAEQIDALIDEMDSTGDWVVLPQGYQIDGECERIDAATVEVDECSVLFKAYSHHGDGTEIETQVLNVDFLQEIGKELTEIRVATEIKAKGQLHRAIETD